MVKFGKYLAQNRVPEWESQYVRYKKLKKTLKSIRKAHAERVERADIEGIALSAAAWAESHLHSADENSSDHSSGGRMTPSRVPRLGTMQAGSGDDEMMAAGGSDVENPRDSHAGSEEEGKGQQSGAAPRPASSLGRMKDALNEGHIAASPSAPLPSTSPALSTGSSDRQSQRDELLRAPPQLQGALISASNAPSPAASSRALNSTLFSLLGPSTFNKLSKADNDVGHTTAAGATTETAEHSSPASVRRSSVDEATALTDMGNGSVSSASSFNSPPPTASLRAAVPSIVRADTYERIFFDIADEDLHRINTFFRSQEQFFLTKVDILSKQISSFLSSTHDDEAAQPILRPAADAEGNRERDGEQATPHSGHAPATNRRTPTGGSARPWNSALKLRSKLSQKKYRAALAKAVQELYRGLTLLKNYRILNFTGLVKILKKHDKVSSHKVSPALLPLVQSAYFFSSPILDQFLERVEHIYEHTFCAGDRKAAMDVLRPSPPPLSSWLLFSLGFTAGLSLILVVFFALMLAWGEHLSEHSLPDDLIAIAPVFRCLFLLILSTWLWGAVVHQYQKHQLNFEFIFEIDAHRLSVPQILSVACKATLLFFIFLDLYLFLLLLHEQAIQDAALSSPFDHALTKGTAYNLQPQWIHLTLWLLLFVVAVCPFDFFYRSTRRYLFGTLWKIVISPFSSVNFKDFFIADWLCSLVSVLADVSYTICFYGTGSFHDNENHRCAKVNSRYVLWVVSFLPYIFRLLQCLRRYRETGVSRQAWNAAKYSTSLLVTLTSLLDKTYGGPGTYWRALWIVIAIVGTAYSYCWDIVFDWSLWSGVLDRNSSDKWLRPKLTIENRYVYHGAISLNLLLRGFWVLTISPAYTDVGIPNDIKLFLVYSLEVIRRAMWSFFRLENEHLNNVGQFRAVNIVPIPQLAVMDDEEVTDKLMLSRAPDILAEPHVMQRVMRRQSSIRLMGGAASAISIANRHLIVNNGKRQSMYAHKHTTPIVESEHESGEIDSTRDTLNADAERRVKRDQIKPTELDTEELEDNQRINLHIDPALHSPPDSRSPTPPPSAALRSSQIEMSARRAGHAPALLRTPGSARGGNASHSDMSVVVLHGESDSSSSDYDDAVESPPANSDTTAAMARGQRSPTQAEKHARKMSRREQRRMRKEAAARAAEDAADDELRSRDHDESGNDRGRALVSSGPTRLVRTLSGRNVVTPRSTMPPSPLVRSHAHKLASGSASSTRLEQMAALAEAADEIDHADTSRALAPAMGVPDLSNAAFPRSNLHARTGAQAGATAIPRPTGHPVAIAPLMRQRSLPSDDRRTNSVGPPSALPLPAHLQPVTIQLLRHYSNDAAAELELELQLASLGDASERPPAPSPTAAHDRPVNGAVEAGAGVAAAAHAHKGDGST